MPIPLIAAGIGAVGAIAGGVIKSNATKSAARISQQATDQQIANSNANRDYQYGLNSSAINGGNAADSRIQALLNLGGDTAGARAGFDAFRGSTGYDFRVSEGEGAINSNAYARGMGNSGATLKALTQYGQNVASQEFGNYLGQLGNVSASGANARGLVAGIGGNTVAQNNNALATNASNQGNAKIANGENWSGVLQNLAALGGNAIGGGGGKLQSSYMVPRFGG